MSNWLKTHTHEWQSISSSYVVSMRKFNLWYTHKRAQTLVHFARLIQWPPLHSSVITQQPPNDLKPPNNRVRMRKQPQLKLQFIAYFLKQQQRRSFLPLADFWVHCNDSNLELCSIEDVMSSQAYILFYSLRKSGGGGPHETAVAAATASPTTTSKPVRLTRSSNSSFE